MKYSKELQDKFQEAILKIEKMYDSEINELSTLWLPKCLYDIGTKEYWSDYCRYHDTTKIYFIENFQSIGQTTWLLQEDGTLTQNIDTLTSDFSEEIVQRLDLPANMFRDDKKLPYIEIDQNLC